MGQARQIDDESGMSATPPIAAKCCTVIVGARGQWRKLNRRGQLVECDWSLGVLNGRRNLLHEIQEGSDLHGRQVAGRMIGIERVDLI